MLNWNTYLPRLILSSLLFKIFWGPVRIKSPCGEAFVESLEPRVLLKSRRVNRREHHKYKSRLDTLTSRFLNCDIYLSLSVVIPHNNWNNIDDPEKPIVIHRSFAPPLYARCTPPVPLVRVYFSRGALLAVWWYFDYLLILIFNLYRALTSLLVLINPASSISK